MAQHNTLTLYHYLYSSLPLTEYLALRYKYIGKLVLLACCRKKLKPILGVIRGFIFLVAGQFILLFFLMENYKIQSI